ncbi:MAG: YigZ family protein [Methylococcales bacterium]|nr:YigZ family protein [Methylococcales bacterium]
MQYIDKISESNAYEVNKSIFVGIISPYKDFDICLNQVMQIHPKASHYVYAYRYQVANNLFEKANDDGEPKSCAGKPILNILQKLDFINTAIIVVRYFGGVKLGAGGLIRAYGNCAKLSIESTIAKPYIKLSKTSIKSHIKNLDLIRYSMKEYQIEENDIEYQGDQVSINISATKEQLYSFILEMKERNILNFS